MGKKVNVCSGAKPDKIQLSRELRKGMTASEALLWSELRMRKCSGFNFRRQQVLLGFVVDFYCASKRLAVEVDGTVHLTQQQYDFERTEALVEAGITVIRFHNEDVFSDLRRVRDEIARILQQM